MLVDDVINSGWTVQRAMTTLWQRGRPAAVKLAVLIDRGHRAVPIRPNYVGKNIPTARAERVQVRLGDPSGDTGRAKTARPRRHLLDGRIAQGSRGRRMSRLLLRGGRVIDPAREIDETCDLLVSDGQRRSCRAGRAAQVSSKMRR